MKDFPQAHPLLAPVVELALQAGEAILPFWRTATEVMTKTDDSPVTAADLAAGSRSAGRVAGRVTAISAGSGIGKSAATRVCSRIAAGVRSTARMPASR